MASRLEAQTSKISSSWLPLELFSCWVSCV